MSQSKISNKKLQFCALWRVTAIMPWSDSSPHFHIQNLNWPPRCGLLMPHFPCLLSFPAALLSKHSIVNNSSSPTLSKHQLYGCCGCSCSHRSDPQPEGTFIHLGWSPPFLVSPTAAALQHTDASPHSPDTHTAWAPMAVSCWMCDFLFVTHQFSWAHVSALSNIKSHCYLHW